MLKETLRSAFRSVCALALAVSLTSDGNPARQVRQLPGVETPVQDYPKLKNFPAKGQGSFTTRKGTRIDWYNYLDQTFNPVAAREMFSYFQDLVPANGLTIPMVYRGRDQQAIIFPRTGIQQVALFITPENALRPSNVTIIIPGHGADFMNRALAIEACQQFILISALIDNNRPLNEQIADQAQEELCRSLGIALAMRQHKVPYGFYRQEVRVRTGSDYEPIILDKRTYNGIPFVGRVIKSGN